MRPTATSRTSLDVTKASPASRAVLDLSGRPEAMATAGKNAHLSWAARTDVGSVREHNEDSYLVEPPLFVVCDGMGGHAAGEVASSIAVRTLANEAPEEADAAALGEAVEAANRAVIAAPSQGLGREGMGCTCTACIIADDRMAVGHVGDSRLYLLHNGTLVRVTHDHSLVEEMVDAGEITADEARTHPHRSWVTRALGSDPDMYADHFTLDVESGERIIICSDGLSSMIEDAEIEDIAVSTPSPDVCADTLVSAAIVAGGHDNVTCIVIDVLSDGTEEAVRHSAKRAVALWGLGGLALLAGIILVAVIIVNRCWYLSDNSGYVAVYQGVSGDLLGLSLSRLDYVSDIPLATLPEALQHQLQGGIPMGSEDEALATVNTYKTQIESAQAQAQNTAAQVSANTKGVGASDSGAATSQDTSETSSKTTNSAPSSSSSNTAAQGSTTPTATSQTSANAAKSAPSSSSQTTQPVYGPAPNPSSSQGGA